MKITKDWLKKEDACSPGKKWFENQVESDGVIVVTKLMAEKKYPWANWLIVRLMDKPQIVNYAIFAAEQVLHIFESECPGDNRPRLLIEIAKHRLKDKSATADIVAPVAHAAHAARAAAADCAAAAAAYAAATAYTDDADAAAAYAAAAAVYTDDVFCAAADAEKEKLSIKILNYGLELLGKK